MTVDIYKFVLDPRSHYLGDPYAIAAREAMLVYASAIRIHDQALASELEKVVYLEQKMETD